MKFGFFDDKEKEYVITSPATPLPWINYLGNENFFSLISNTCGGYSFYKDAKLLRLTRYRYNNVPADMAAITLSGIAIQSGHPPGSLSKQSLTVMNAVMDLVTAVLLLLKTKSRRSLLLLCR